jgi:hypothetical protein
MILAEQDDEWQDGRRYFRSDTMPLIDAAIDHKGVAAADGELTNETRGRRAGRSRTEPDRRRSRRL